MKAASESNKFAAPTSTENSNRSVKGYIATAVTAATFLASRQAAMNAVSNFKDKIKHAVKDRSNQAKRKLVRSAYASETNRLKLLR